jgi:hypothetical protein
MMFETKDSGIVHRGCQLFYKVVWVDCKFFIISTSKVTLKISPLFIPINQRCMEYSTWHDIQGQYFSYITVVLESRGRKRSLIPKLNY